MWNHLRKFTGKTVFSVKKHNSVIEAVNPLLNMRFVRGATSEVIYGDREVLLQLNPAGSADSGGMRYRGEYTNVPDPVYAVGDVVRVTPESVFATTYADPGPSVPGVYVLIKESPGEEDFPLHPLQAGGETAFWECLATQPSEMEMCDPATGESVTYLVDAQPKPD